MPHPISYPVGTQDDDQTRSIDIVHIEPSIREGVHLVSSLYGPLASAPLFRYPPVNTFAPYITGDPQIPNILTCNSGQWDASPAAVFAYQWMSNGTDIPGANDQTWLSTVEYDNTIITCEVRGYNYLGEAYAMTSNSIPISLIEPIELYEQENILITGLQANLVQTTRDERTIITSGMSADNRQDVNRGVAYFLTGISADQRNDVNAMNMCFITGIPQGDTLSVLERDFGIAVISYYAGLPFTVDGVPQPMDLKNPSAEIGMLGWEVSGAASYEGTYGSGGFDGAETEYGDLHWHGGWDVDAGQRNIPYSYMWQDVPIYDMHIPEVDLGNCSVIVQWHQFSEENQDQGNVKLEFYASNDTVLVYEDGPGLYSSPNDVWLLREIDVPIPPGTRYIRIIPEFNLQAGQNNDAQIDNIKMDIYRGSRLVSRSFGPTFDHYRLRFLRANTYSGGALSEVEFRENEGTADVCVGGTPLFGSAGLGVINADAAFDDARNTNYWAGAENAITLGTSWIGYQLTAPVRIREVDITARPGSNALQVPKEFYFEGSNDGLDWTPIYYADEELHTGVGVSYNSGEQKSVVIPSGPIPYLSQTVTGGALLWYRNNFSNDDWSSKGNRFKCHSRMDISHLRVLLNDNQVTPFNCRLQLYRMNTQKGGMVIEVLEDIPFQSQGTGNTNYWHEEACVNGPHEFEVNDIFLVRFVDQDASTNAEDPLEARTYYNSDTDIRAVTKNARKIVTFLGPTEGGATTFLVGQTNTNTDRIYYAVDFRGDIF